MKRLPRQDKRTRTNPSFLGRGFAIASAAALAAVVWLARGREPVADLRRIDRQNVLLITIDTLRADALGSYGGRAATPVLDRLAAGGVRFDFAHAHAVLTLPSHTTILTGTYPFQHGIRDNSGYRLAPDARTAATILRSSGYTTAAFVAAFPLHSRFGLNTGFDVYDDRFGETRAPTEFVMPERPATEVVALARHWLAEHAEPRTPNPATAPSTQNHEPRAPPWFLWVHLFDPHAPYRPVSPFDTYARPYDGEVAATDAALAPLLEDVRRGRPTLVIVTSDHGEALGDHGEQTHGLFAYESTLRVPLLIAEVGGVPSSAGTGRGEVSHVSARHIDILPTVLDATGVNVPADLPGRTLLPAAERHGSAPRPSYFEAMSSMLNRGWAPLSGVLAGRDKYIDVPIAERYDLASDAAEAVNLAGRAPRRDLTLSATLRSFNPSLPGRRQSEDPEAIARLRSLGYVSGSAPLKTKYSQADDPKSLVGIDQDFHRGVDLYASGQYDEAIKVYRDIVTRRPDMAIAYRHLAFVAWQSGKTSLAVETLQHAVAAGMTNSGVVTQLANYLAESGRAAAAIPLLEPIAAGDAADPDALNGLGIAYARAGRTADAQRAFERMLAIDPASAMALTNLGTLDLERGDLTRARTRFERAVTIDPTSSSAYAGLGVVALKSGLVDQAISSWQRAVELDRTNFDALYNLGTTLARTNPVEARPFLEQFARTAPPSLYAKDIRDVNEMLQSYR
jgi:arylsulfatase A-like enzyme/Flp pilus assembly protein TadD